MEALAAFVGSADHAFGWAAERAFLTPADRELLRAFMAGEPPLLPGARHAGDKLALTVQVCLAAGVMSILAAMVLPAPAPQSWPYLAASVVIHVVYYALVGLSYDRTDLSVAYPLMRGLPPLGTTAPGAGCWPRPRRALAPGQPRWRPPWARPGRTPAPWA